MPTCQAPIFQVRTCLMLNSAVPTCQAPTFPMPTCPRPYYPVPICLMRDYPVPTCPVRTSPGPTFPMPTSPVQYGRMEKNAGRALLENARKILPGRLTSQREAAAHEAALEWEWGVDGTCSYTAARLCFLVGSAGGDTAHDSRDAATD